MNSSKLLRAGVPVLGLCVITVLGSGCRSEVLSDRPSVPPAERELIDNQADFNNTAAADFDSAPAAKTAKKTAAKGDSGKFVYPRFEDTDHTPIYSAPKGKKSSAAVGTGSVYIVRRGDSLSKIAARHRVRTIDLAKANNLQLTSVIRIGQKLTIPGGKAVVSSRKTARKSAAVEKKSSAPRSGLYVVRRGDSISRIAKRCKVKRADLMAVNNINENTILRIGQTLKLPGAQVVNEASVIVDQTPAPAAEPAEKVAETVKKSKDLDESDALNELEGAAAAGDKGAAAAASASETAAAAVAETAPAAKAPSADSAALVIQQDISVDDFCKSHNVSKADLIRMNAKVTESTVMLKKGDVIILP